MRYIDSGNGECLLQESKNLQEFTNLESQIKRNLNVLLRSNTTMKSLVNRKSVMEFECKFKGHIPDQEDEDELFKNPKFPIETVCDRCGADIKIEIDPNDNNYYFVTEL